MEKVISKTLFADVYLVSMSLTDPSKVSLDLVNVSDELIEFVD